MNIHRVNFLWILVLAATMASTTQGTAAYLEDWERMKNITPHSYVCPHSVVAPNIDGKLDDAVWKSAPWTKDFVDIEGTAKPKPRFRTRAKMLWDDNYFYVAVEMEEPHIWATLTNHDAVIFHDPDFEVFIDPDGDSHDYYEFEINALNTGWDLRLPKPYKDGGPALNSWEIPGLKSAIHVQGTLNQPGDRDKGWTLEIAFPWKVLGEFAGRPSPPNEGDQWRVSFSRVEWQVDIVDGQYRKVPGKKEDNWVWSPQGIIDMHRPEKWGYVQFTRQKPGKAKFAPDPSAPARAALQEIYYMQKDFHKANKRWAGSLPGLPWNSARRSSQLGNGELQLTRDGYQASVNLRLPSGRWQRWHIQQDAKVWSD